MNKQQTTFDKFLSEVKKEYRVINNTFTFSTTEGGYGQITIIYNEPSDEDACVAVHNKVLEGGTTVTLMIIGKESSGWGSIPVSSQLLGKRVADFPVGVVFRMLPKGFKDKQNAREYLAKSPDMLISSLSSVLNTQKEIITHQSNTIEEVDWHISHILGEVKGKAKTIADVYSNYLSKEKFYAFKNIQEIFKKEP